MNGQCGPLFPVGNIEALAEIMEMIDTGEITRSDFEENIPRSIARFTPEAVLPQIIELF